MIFSVSHLQFVYLPIFHFSIYEGFLRLGGHKIDTAYIAGRSNRRILDSQLLQLMSQE